jgi:NTE family protein
MFIILPGKLAASPNQGTVWLELDEDTTKYLEIHNLPSKNYKKRKVALVLSGGGARGFAHIGVLKALEENQIDLNLIIGSSIGSIIGGLYCAGYNAQQIQEITKEIDWKNLYSDPTYRSHLFLSQKDIPRRHLLQLRMDGVIPYIPRSITYGQNVYQLIYKQIISAEYQASNSFDDLKIPFRSIATDLITGNRVVIGDGDLAEAINASLAFPLLFAPVEINGMWLVDGGITDNLPVDVAITMGADFILAVDATSPLRSTSEMQAPWEIADQVTTIMMEERTEQNAMNANLALKPELHQHRAGDFTNIDSIIQIGYQHTLNFLDSIRSSIRGKSYDNLRYDSISGVVSDVYFEGIDRESIEQYGFETKVKAGSIYSSMDVKSDLETFSKSGFFRIAKAGINNDSLGILITYYLTPQPYIVQVVLNHNDILSDSAITNLEMKFSEKNLNTQILTDALISIKRDLFEKGYSLAKIDNITYFPETGLLTIDFNEGLIDEIRIEGNNKTKDFVVLREFLFRKGDFFQSEQAVQSVQDIYSTGLFDRVALNYKQENKKNILVIRVKEKKSLLMRIGGHASLERSIEGFLEFEEENFVGSGIKLDIFGSLGEFERHANASLSTPRVLKTYFTFKLSTFYDDEEYRYFENNQQLGYYQLVSKGAKFIFGHQFGRLGQISAELRLEDIDLTSENFLFPFPGEYRIRSVTIRSVVDKRDRLPFAKRGIYNRWFWETGNQRVLGGSVSFTRVFIGLEGYYPMLRHFNWRPFIFGGTGDLTVPFSEFFYFGGQKSFPGLYEREKIGRQFLQAGLDFRYQIGWNLPIDAFLKAKYTVGAAWERADAQIDGSDFLHSFSISAAVNSLLGPIQATYGSVVDGRSQFYFSIGFDF